MAWLYVPSMDSHSSLELEGLNSDCTSQTQITEPWVTVNGKQVQRPLSWPGWKTRPWIKLLLPTISKPLMADHGVDLWISSLEDTRARERVRPASVLETKTPDGSGPISNASSEKYSQKSAFLKMSPTILTWDFLKSPQTFKLWGIALRQDSLARRKQAQAMRDSDCLSWPTAKSSDWKSEGMAAGMRRRSPNLNIKARAWPTPNVSRNAQTAANPTPGQTGGDTLGGVAQNWGTPTVGTNNGIGQDNPTKGSRLQDQAATWPTPKTMTGGANSNRENRPNTGGADLQEIVKSWPTPSTNEDKYRLQGNSQQSNGLAATAMKSHYLHQGPKTLKPGKPSSASTRRLNPRFVELLMGWLIGWTDYDSAVTGFPLWLQRMRTALSEMPCGNTRPDENQMEMF